MQKKMFLSYESCFKAGILENLNQREKLKKMFAF